MKYISKNFSIKNNVKFKTSFVYYEFRNFDGNSFIITIIQYQSTRRI